MISKAFSTRSLLISIIATVFLLSIFLLTSVSPTIKSAPQGNVSSRIENYDIRLDRSASEKINSYKFEVGKTNKLVSDLHKTTHKAKSEFERRFPDLNVELNEDLKVPEVISGKAFERNKLLTAPSNKKRKVILQEFLKQNSRLFGLDKLQINELKVTADYTNPNGILSFVHLEQEINGIPIFRGEIKAGFNERNQIFRVINNLAPNIDKRTAGIDFDSPEKAVLNAAKYISIDLNKSAIKQIEKHKSGKIEFVDLDQFAGKTTAEKMYFPIDQGVIRTAWRVLFWTKDAAFYVIVDAKEGTLLWRKNISEHQTEIATYNVYGNQMSFMKTSDSPSPNTPGCLDPNNCPEPAAIMRTDFTLIGNEPPYTFNNLGWIPDGENRTIGNNAEAGIDRDGTQGIDPNGWAFAGPNRIFNYSYNPAPGIPEPGEEPLPTTQTYPPSEFQQGSITQAFYATNRFHDETYLLGFTESAFNFQDDNFGRGGAEGDSISVEIQDSSGTNSANFSTPADGGRPRAQFFVFTATTPDRDGALDNQIVVHEMTHGLSARLHGNTAGLGSNMSRGMGEGWSDFFALALLTEPTDDPCGVNSVGSYSLDDYFYGIRRFPTSRYSCTGPNGNPYNPLTFADLNAGCDVSDGEFPRGPIGSNTCDQVHNAGEIWSQMLWEVRGVLIEEHGAIEGNKRALQYIIDGMKLAPLNPTFIQERDAIISAANASDPNDTNLVRQGFAIRGMGALAEVISASPANVIESFAPFINVDLVEPFTFVELQGNGNGFPEPGETLAFSISLQNVSGNTITDVSANINDGTNVSFGDILDGQTVSNSINYAIPTDVECGSLHEINVNISSSAGSKIVTRKIRIGVAESPAIFENPSIINVPSSSSTSGAGPGEPNPSTINVSGLIGQYQIKVELTDVAHTWADDLDVMLEGPNRQQFIIMSDVFGNTDGVASTITFSDDGVDGLPPNSGPIASGDYKPSNVGSGDTFDAPAPQGPYSNPAPAGNATFENTFGLQSQNLNGEWKLWIDDDTNNDIGTISGWKISFQQYICFECVTVCTPTKSIADFDGDGQSDLSVFRPSEGIWYINRSTDGFTAVNWGIATDELVPSDYDGDNKTDLAIFRANADSAQPDFYILNSSDFTFTYYSWGLPDDIPVINDFDGDGKADISIFRPSNRVFYILQSTSGVYASNPMPDGIPLTGDFDGDGRGDFAFYNNGNWFITESVNDHQTNVNYTFGLSNDQLTPGDFDGDGRTDLAVYRPSNGVWYIQNSTGGVDFVQFGLSDDIPTPADFDGDGKADIAVYRNGVWYINQSSGGIFITQFGLSSDMPIQNSYLP